MEGAPFGQSDAVDRRRWLQLAGVAGLALTVGACATEPAADEIRSAPGTPNPPDVRPALPASQATTAPAPVAVSAALLCRDAWGAQPARRGGRPHTITRMTLHHTAVALSDNRDAPGRLRQHQRYHQNEHGWIDIAYHVGIDRNGNVYELRTPELVGDTATAYDPTGHFLVVCEGDFDREPVSEAQLNSTATVFAWAAQTFRVASDTVAGHRDLAATSCPGANLYDHVASGELKRRIDDLLTAGVVNLQKVCGPEAAARTAEIEAGR